MSFVECPKPPNQDLALRNQTGSLHGYERDLATYMNRVLRLGEKAEDVGDISNYYALAGLRHELVNSIGQIFTVSDFAFTALSSAENTEMARVYECNRRRALGTLGVVKLIESVSLASALEQTGIKPEEPFDKYQDGIIHGELGTVCDIGMGPHGMPIEPRVHLFPEEIELLLGEDYDSSEESWHREGDLFVRHAPQCDLTDNLREIVALEGIDVDWDGMRTLYPKLAASHARTTEL